MNEEIHAFLVKHQENIAAGTEFTRRWEKGIPSDRWTDGERGMHKVAKGIRARDRIIELLGDELLRIAAEERQRGLQAMETSADPMHAEKYK